eukprot:533391_1
MAVVMPEESIFTKIKSWFAKHPNIQKYAIGLSIASGLYTLRNIFWKSYYKYYQYPPYISLGLPFIGCIIPFYKDPDTFASTTVSNSGQFSLTTVPLGLQHVIFVNDNKTAKKVLKTREIGMLRHLTKNNQFQMSSFLMINGKQWLHQRKFMLSTFGIITNSSFVYLTVKQLLQKDLIPQYINKAISENNGQLFISEYCQFLGFYSIFTAIFGNQLKDIHTMNNNFYKSYLASRQEKRILFALYVAYETLINIKLPNKFFQKIFGMQELHEKFSKNLEFYLQKNEIINCNHKWNKLNKNKSVMVNKIFQADMNVDQITADCYALLETGIPTVAKQIEFGLVMLCKYPKVQKRIYNELSKFDEYKPCLLHKDLHFLRAFVHEILRFAVVLPLGLPHKCVGDVTLNGYTIYKGSTVIINHLSIHHQQKNGDKFNIYRWLDSNKKFSKKKKQRSFLIFGYCENNCLGKNLAMQLMYSIFAILIRKYIMFNHSIPDNISRTWGITRDIKPEIPVYFKHRRRHSRGISTNSDKVR